MEEPEDMRPHSSTVTLWPGCFNGFGNGLQAKHTKPFSIRNLLQRQRFGLPTNFGIDICEWNNVQTLYQRDLKGHTGCVNAVEFNRNEDYFASGGDDCRVFLWKTSTIYSDEVCQPVAIMKQRHRNNIFALGFTHDTRKLLSAGNDRTMIVHDVETGDVIYTYAAGCYYSLSVHPENDNIIAAATDFGRVYIYDIRMSPEEPVLAIRQSGENYCASFNNVSPNLLAIANRRAGLCVTDIREGSNFYARAGKRTVGSLFASWNESGTGLFCIRSNKSPFYWDCSKKAPLICNDEEYRNGITIKSCQMIGNNYGITGSDKWHIYCWKIPADYDDKLVDTNAYVEHSQTNQAFTVLRGHRSVVNHIRYSKRDDILLSCGVEKVVKCWSGYKLSMAYRDPVPRTVNNHIGVSHGDYDEGEEEDLNTLRMFDTYALEESPDVAYATNEDMTSDSEDSYTAPPRITENTSAIGRRLQIHFMGRLHDDSDNDLADPNMLREIMDLLGRNSPASDSNQSAEVALMEYDSHSSSDENIDFGDDAHSDDDSDLDNDSSTSPPVSSSSSSNDSDTSSHEDGEDVDVIDIESSEDEAPDG